MSEEFSNGVTAVEILGVAEIGALPAGDNSALPPGVVASQGLLLPLLLLLRILLVVLIAATPVPRPLWVVVRRRRLLLWEFRCCFMGLRCRFLGVVVVVAAV